MIAVVEINDKQHLVEVGDIFTIDGNIDSKKVIFKNILMIQNDTDIHFGQPIVDDASVDAEVIESGNREKDIVFKFKRKTGYKLTKGHKQNSTLIKITNINFKTDKSKVEKTKTEKPKAEKTKSVKKTTEPKTEKKSSKEVKN